MACLFFLMTVLFCLLCLLWNRPELSQAFLPLLYHGSASSGNLTILSRRAT